MSRASIRAADARAEALEDLRRAVDALRLHLDSPDHQADLYMIEEAASRLSQPGTPNRIGIADFDPNRLSHLLEITGPELGPELLVRLTEDLTATQTLLAAGAEATDWKSLREGSHVLISLAGSVGAISLQTMAESLNALAHAQDRAGLAALMAPMTDELAALIRLIRATKVPNRSAS